MPDLTPFFQELFPESDFTNPDDAKAAAAWVVANKSQFAAALREYLAAAQTAEDNPELSELL
jgi:hypothetical protein